MEISNVAKQILNSIGAGEKSHSQLQKEFGENTNVGSETQLLAQMGIIEEVDGFYSLTDAGLKVAALPGNEIPDDIEADMRKQREAEANIKIDKPGEAAVAYRKGMGYKDSDRTSAQAKYQAGIQRMLRGDTPGSVQPQGDFSDDGEPSLEGSDEGKEPTSVQIVSRGHNACPIFGNASLNFCISMCGGWDNGCGVTDKMAERLKP